MRDLSFRRGVVYCAVSALLLFAALPGGGGIWPLLFVALVPFLYLQSVEDARKRFLLGFLGGVFHFVCQLYWIVIVLTRYGGLPLIVAVLGLFLLVCYMALYFGIFLYVAGWVKKRLSFLLLLVFPACFWVGLDWFRSFFLGGFPWLDLGYGLWQAPLLLQTADLFGHYGLTFLIVLVNGAVFFLLQKEPCKRKIIGGGVVLLICVAAVFYGRIRELHLDGEMASAPKAAIGVVQGNRNQTEKWSADLQGKTVEIYLNKSGELFRSLTPPQLLVWPETALPFYPSRSPYFEGVQRFARDNGSAILTGSPWFEIRDREKNEIDFYNSALLVTDTGKLGGLYHKSHLVPFGEYVPLKRFLFFLSPLVEQVGDFSVGTIQRPLTTGSIHAGVLICYESIFPGLARRWVKSGANVLVNITNDAWYGRSSAPHQSWAMSVLRAVETRRSLVRAANTGISGFVDPLGRRGAQSPLFVTWSMARTVELLEIQTVYSSWGYLFPVFCALLILGVLVTVMRWRPCAAGKKGVA